MTRELFNFKKILKDFIKKDLFLFKRFHDGKIQLEQGEKWLNGNETLLLDGIKEYDRKMKIYLECMFKGNTTCMNKMTEEGRIQLAHWNKKLNESYSDFKTLLDEKLIELKKHKLNMVGYKVKIIDAEKQINDGLIMIWQTIYTLYFVSGLIGCLISKYLLDHIGRKASILFGFLIMIIGCTLTFSSLIFESPVCFIFGNLINGVQTGMAFIQM